MYNEKIEELIKAALADGALTEKEKQILFKKAQTEGIDLDEFEMVLDARLVELQKAEKEKSEKSAPKSTKYGDVRKCPVCGALVPAMAGICPECGYEFSGVEVSKAVQSLYEEINSIKDNDINSLKTKANIIESFPVPNTKADIAALMMVSKTHILDEKDQLANAYFKLYSQCAEQAKVLFPNDKLLLPYIQDLSNLKKQVNSFGHKWNKTNSPWKKFVRFCISIIGVAFLVWLVIFLVNTPIRLESTIIELAEEGNYEKAIEKFEDGKKDYKEDLEWGKEAFIFLSKKYAKENIWAAADFYAKNADIMDYKRYDDKIKSAIFKDELEDAQDNTRHQNNETIEFLMTEMCKQDAQRAEAWYEDNKDNLYSSHSDYSFLYIVKEAYIDNCDVENMWRICKKMYRDDHFYDNHIFNDMSYIVENLSRNGNKEKAIEFINDHVKWFDKGDEYTSAKAKKELTKIALSDQ